MTRRDRVCMGTLVSREQYLVDPEGGRRDGRLPATGKMHPVDVHAWTAAIARREQARRGSVQRLPARARSGRPRP